MQRWVDTSQILPLRRRRTLKTSGASTPARILEKLAQRHVSQVKIRAATQIYDDIFSVSHRYKCSSDICRGEYRCATVPATYLKLCGATAQRRCVSACQRYHILIYVQIYNHIKIILYLSERQSIYEAAARVDITSSEVGFNRGGTTEYGVRF